MKRLLLLMLCLCVWATCADAKAEKHACFGFAGEKLTFDVGWEFVNAGTAEMEATTSSYSTYRVLMQAKTNQVLDLFKKVRDSIDARGICRDGKMQSTVFDLNQHERRYRAVKKTRYDWEHDQVQYTHNNKTEVFKVPAGHLSVLDAFFLVRSMPLKPGDKVEIPVFDSRKTYQLIVHVNPQTQKLFAPWGQTVETLVVEPELKTAGVFSSTGKIKLWLTHDEHHVPLKLTAKIKIGRIVGELTNYAAAKL